MKKGKPQEQDVLSIIPTEHPITRQKIIMALIVITSYSIHYTKLYDKQELMDLVSNMDRIIEVGLDMLKTIEKTEQDKKIMWHNAYKNITGSIVSASKTKMEMITPDKKDDENNNMDRLF